MQGYFGRNLAVRKAAKSKNRRLMSQMGKSEAIISDMGDTIRNSLLRAADTISGCYGNQNDFENLKEIGKLFHLEGDFGNTQKECGNLENLKNVGDFDEEKGSSTSEGKVREMQNLQRRIKKLQREIETWGVQRGDRWSIKISAGN